MWVTKRRTKQAKIHHKKNLLRISSMGGVVLGCVIFGIIVYRTFFLTPPLLIPLMEIPGVLGYSSEDEGIVQLKHELQKKVITYEQLQKMPDTNYLLRLKDNGEVVIASNRNIPSQIASLQLILSRLTMEGKRFARLDMRFNKPVLRSE